MLASSGLHKGLVMGLGRAGRWGFTLIELMMVSAIIGLLASIALPRFANLINKAKEATYKGSLGSLRSALSIYYADTEGLYPRWDAMGTVNGKLGVYVLNGKYIDLGAVKFSPPNYRERYFLTTFNNQSTTAWELFRPASPVCIACQTEFNSTFHSFAAGLYPSYSVLRPVSTAPAWAAAIGISGFSATDLSGRNWSEW